MQFFKEDHPNAYDVKVASDLSAPNPKFSVSVYDRNGNFLCTASNCNANVDATCSQGISCRGVGSYSSWCYCSGTPEVIRCC